MSVVHENRTNLSHQNSRYTTVSSSEFTLTTITSTTSNPRTTSRVYPLKSGLLVSEKDFVCPPTLEQHTSQGLSSQDSAKHQAQAGGTV